MYAAMREHDGEVLMRIELRSKLFDAAEYDFGASRLTLFLLNGQIREFDDVPSYVIDNLRKAKSPGRYYFAFIRDEYPHHS